MCPCTRSALNRKLYCLSGSVWLVYGVQHCFTCQGQCFLGLVSMSILMYKGRLCVTCLDQLT